MMMTDVLIRCDRCKETRRIVMQLVPTSRSDKITFEIAPIDALPDGWRHVNQQLFCLACK